MKLPRSRGTGRRLSVSHPARNAEEALQKQRFGLNTVLAADVFFSQSLLLMSADNVASKRAITAPMVQGKTQWFDV